MKVSAVSKISNALISLGINGKNLSLLIIANKAVNLELHKAVSDYVYTQKLLRIRIGQVKESKGKKQDVVPEKENEHHDLFMLVNRLMILNAFLEMSSKKMQLFDITTAESPDFTKELPPALKEIHYQKCLNLIEALNNISSNIEVILRRPEKQISLGSATVEMEGLAKEFETLKEYRHAVCQMINIQRELDCMEASEVVSKKEKPKAKKTDEPGTKKRELSDDFRKIFFSSTLERADLNCPTIVNLENFFKKQSVSLKSVLDAGFEFSISDNEKPGMFISDGIEWEKYKKNASVRFGCNKLFKYFTLLPSLSEDHMHTTLTDGLKYYEQYKDLLEKTKELYFKLKLDEIWPDYKVIHISRTSWTDISLNYLQELLETAEKTAKDNLDGARYIFKEKIIEGILSAPSYRMTPPHDAIPQLSLYGVYVCCLNQK